MTEKAVCLIEQDPDVKIAADQFEEFARIGTDRIKFLKKQMQDEEKRLGEESRKVWDDLERKLKAKGMLKDYNPAKHALRMDHDAGVLFMYDAGKRDTGFDGLISLLKRL